ncbi:hypothetical protein [Archangium sp.]|nr:hypothetical protein [Archangium sp.]HYO59776.1 hypothetical protein [Archangium sp.]
MSRVVQDEGGPEIALELHELLRRPRRLQHQPEPAREVRLSAAERHA